MKNQILITIVLITIVIFISILSTSNIFSSNTENENCCTNVVKFHVMGCDTCMGYDIEYCIDGGEPHFVNVYQFAWDCIEGYHTICVQCLYGKIGYLKFYCPGTGGFQDEYIYVEDDEGRECDCSPSKN